MHILILIGSEKAKTKLSFVFFFLVFSSYSGMSSINDHRPDPGAGRYNFIYHGAEVH